MHLETEITKKITSIKEPAAPVKPTKDAGEKKIPKKPDTKVQMFFHGPKSDFFKRPDYQGQPDSEKMNNSSLIFRIEYDKKSYLFPGDAGQILWNYSIPTIKAAGKKLELAFFKLPHHGSEKSFPKTLFDSVVLLPEAIAVATRHISNQGVTKIDDIHPTPDIINMLADSKSGGLIDKSRLHAFDHDLRNFSPFSPFVYSYVYDIDQEHLIGYRYFFKNDIPQTFIDSHKLELKNGYLMLETPGEAKKAEIIKVLSVWLDKQIKACEAEIHP
jgi:hypothetical protein